MKYCPKCGSDLAASEVDGHERLRCTSDDCPFVFWDNPTPVVAAIAELNGQVVLTRKDGWPPKMYGVVAGFLEKGETVESSVLREVCEELGLEGEIVEFVGYYSFLQRNQVILAFHVRAEGEIVLGEELAEVKLVDPEKLRPWPIGTGPAVRDWLARRRTSRSA
jgi:NADH pyrophosphatase NudC (nudix superfamily)